jgi:hypothetical protein
MPRSTESKTVTSVHHVCQPQGRARENGPHLVDLRAFVAECEGLPDDLRVTIENGYLDEGGRRTVTFRVRHEVRPDA